MRRRGWLIAAMLAGCSGGGGGDDGGDPIVLGEVHVGEYHLGPVEWTGSFNNACSPYPEAIQTLAGDMLAGLSNELAATGVLCDACIEVTTDLGNTVVARVVTYGVTQAPGNIDVSQAAFDVLDEGEFPRAMTWRPVTCPGSEPVYLQFQTGAHQDWSSFWVRNPRVPVARVEVRSARHAEWFGLRRGGDGTFTDDGGFGPGGFTLRIVGIDGTSIEESFDGFVGGDLLRGAANLR